MKPTVTIDLQALQGPSATRGIGRYVENLSRQLLEEHSRDFDFQILLSQNAPTPAALAQMPWTSVPRVFVPIPPLPWRPQLADALANSYQATEARADIAIVTSPFEGFGNSRTVAPRNAVKWAKHTVVIAYDLIPLRMPDAYLVEPTYRSWYSRQLPLLIEADHILAISNATRSDLHTELLIPEMKITDIRAATWHEAQPKSLDRNTLINDYRITSQYFLYVYQPDARKNPDTLIRAYSKLPLSLRGNTQLVLVTASSQEEARIQRLAHAAGLPDGQIVCTGYVDDDSLMDLYANSIALVFPSLYEGFGLPALEAIRCNALTLAANSSSLPEVVGTPETLFDPLDATVLSRLMVRAATDGDWAAEQRARQQRHAADFSWEASASRTAEVLLQVARKRPNPHRTPTPVVVTTGPLPPTRSGIATYTTSLLKALRQYYRLAGITESTKSGDDVFLQHNLTMYRHDYFPTQNHYYIHHIGNQPDYHGYQLPILERTGGIAVIHDIVLDHFSDFLDRLPIPRSLALALESTPSPRDVRDFQSAASFRAARVSTLLNWIVERSTFQVVHSEHAAATLRQFTSHDTGGVIVIPLAQGIPTDTIPNLSATVQARHSGTSFKIVCPGFVDESKSPFTVIRALAAIRNELSNPQLIFLGECDSRLSKTLYQLADRQGIPLTITGYLDDLNFQATLASADMCLVLRSFDRGETSAAALNALSLGLPTIVNDIGSFREFPDSSVLKVPVNNHLALSHAILSLYEHPEAAQRMAAEAVTHLTLNHSWNKVAKMYAHLVEQL